MKRLINLSTRDLVPGGFFYLSIAILLIAFGFIMLSQAVWDYDFWWHIATGRYIVETKSIPTTDPFSFTSQLPENSNLYPLRERFILTQYWLAQILMYLLYHSFGPAGIVIFRTTLILGVLYLIYRALKDRGVASYITYPALLLAEFNLFRFLGDRPVLFTICFSVASFIMIDDYLRKRSKTFYFLPFLMLLWANLHGGFILGDCIILVFMVTEGIRLLFGNSSLSQREKIIFFLVLFLAIGVSWINPNGFLAFQIAFSNEYAPFYEGIHEYRSPFYLYSNKFAPPPYGFFAALFLFPVILVLRNKKFNPTHLILLIFLVAEAVSASRFTAYYAIIASIVLGTELDLWFKEQRNKLVINRGLLNIAFSVIMLASSVLYLSAYADRNAFAFRDSMWTVPRIAADFIESNGIKGNMLNDMGTGGYLAWRLHPNVKTFIDTRSLNYTVMREYSWMATMTKTATSRPLPTGKTPLWKRLLDHYNINIIVFNPLDIYGKILPLVFNLLDDENWVPVSADVMAVVFLKNTPENNQLIKKYKIPNDVVYNIMIMRASMAAQANKGNPYYIESLGDIFQKVGKRADAIKAYEYSLKRMPDNPEVKQKLDKIMRENTEVKK